MAMYPQELEDLLKEYLTDGIITNAERQVLLNKAMSLNVDPNEFNLYITAQEQKLEQANKAAAAKLKGRTCPYCGGEINDFSDKCPHCDHNITPQASEEVKELIDNLEKALIEVKSGSDIRKNKAVVEGYIRKANLYYSSNPKLQKLVAEVKAETEAAEKAEKSRQNKKAVANFVKNHKWITIIIILCIIGAISSIIEAISESTNKEAHDSTVCAREIATAVDNGDITKAEELFNGFEGGKANLTPGTIKIVEYYLAQNDPDRAAVWCEKLSYDSRDTYKEKVGKVYLEEGEYEKGQKLLSNSFGIYLSDSPTYIKVIKAMKNNGESDADIKAYIEGLVAAMNDQDDKTELRNTLMTAAGL